MIGVIIKQPIPSNGTTTLEISREELAAIMHLQKHYAEIATMIESGVFDFKNGHAIIHRDSDGKMRKIDINLTRFRM